MIENTKNYLSNFKFKKKNFNKQYKKINILNFAISWFL